MTIGTILLVVALICFVLAAVGVGFGRLNLIGAGLACWAASMLLGSNVISGLH
jgi:hypothetical protein